MNPAEAPPAAHPAVWLRLRQWPGRLLDFGVVAALLAVGAGIGLSTTGEVRELSLGRAPLLIVVLIALASLLVRRRHPLWTVAIITVGLLVEAALRSPILIGPVVLVAVYTIAARFPWRMSLPITASVFAVFLVSTSVSHGEWSLANVMSALVPVAAAYVVGLWVGTRVAYIDSLRARAAQLARERELLAQQAVAEERVRIARELHDVVAHHLSLITVQAGALQTKLNGDSAARQSVETIARTGRQAMDEMRRMLGVLRLGAAETPGYEPQPVIAEIPRLVQQARDAGLEVELVVSGERCKVPPGVELSAYRIVQEGLTNVLRHAGRARCRVLLDYGETALELSIADDGRGAAATGSQAGHGLLGMRERVALYGGEFLAAPVPGGGFAVRATLPLAATPR